MTQRLGRVSLAAHNDIARGDVFPHGPRQHVRARDNAAAEERQHVRLLKAEPFAQTRTRERFHIPRAAEASQHVDPFRRLNIRHHIVSPY